MLNRHWKRLADQSGNKSAQKKRNTSRRYDPKKDTSQQSHSLLSPNMSFSKQQSLLPHNISKNLSREKSKIKQQNSQKEEKKSINLDKSKVEDNLLNSKQTVSKVKHSVQNQQAFTQLQKLRKQFERFRQQIFKELERQQKLIQKLIKDAVQNYKKQMNSTIQKVGPVQIKPDFKHNPYVSPRSSKYQAMSPSRFQIKQHASQDTQIPSQTNNDKNFTRFFKAMSSLRTSLNDLENLSEIDQFNNPKSNSEINVQKKNMKWK